MKTIEEIKELLNMAINEHKGCYVGTNGTALFMLDLDEVSTGIEEAEEEMEVLLGKMDDLEDNLEDKDKEIAKLTQQLLDAEDEKDGH